ncbi:uncharacterized protein LOC114355838 [Ostrinia furnacalis]|uniref:uncharacterized protein LOC114355838 n=1 Tax=Ostrinia furnacalis TaxID=93504 RepID=UPI00103B5E7B|nr:uncharacterized protein LOC114355838 [Ostrinia furnacalis]
MHTIIISIAALVAMAHSQTFSSCTDYCNYLQFGQLPIFWRPECKCAMEYQKNNIFKNSLTKIKPHSGLDNSAIYYEPADDYPFRRTSFDKYPIHIVNPTYHKQDNMNAENRNDRRTAKNGETSRSIKKRKLNDSKLHKIDIDADDLPIYLDIDIYKRIKEEKSNEQKTNELKTIKLSEKDLIECINLHILVYSRKSDQDADLKVMWDETKINKYKDLSDSDLMIEIESKCHQPAEIVHKSLEEIKNSWPKKSQSPQDFHGKYIRNNLKDQNKKEKVVAVTDTTETLPTKESMKTVSQYSSTTNSTKDYTDISPNFDHSKINKVYWTTDSSSITYNAEKDVKELNTVTIEPTVNEMFSKSEYDLLKDILPQNPNDAVTLESTTIKEPNTNKEFNEQLLSTKYNMETEPSLSKSTYLDVTATRPSLNKKHKEIMENYMKIPRITTKEFENSTVISIINGTEIIPNSDFVNEPRMALIKDFIYENFDTTSNTQFTSTTVIPFSTRIYEVTTSNPFKEGSNEEIVELNKHSKTYNKTQHGEENASASSEKHSGIQTLPIPYNNPVKFGDKIDDIIIKQRSNSGYSGTTILNEPTTFKTKTDENLILEVNPLQKIITVPPISTVTEKIQLTTDYLTISPDEIPITDLENSSDTMERQKPLLNPSQDASVLPLQIQQEIQGNESIKQPNKSNKTLNTIDEYSKELKQMNPNVSPHQNRSQATDNTEFTSKTDVIPILELPNHSLTTFSPNIMQDMGTSGLNKSIILHDFLSSTNSYYTNEIHNKENGTKYFTSLETTTKSGFAEDDIGIPTNGYEISGIKLLHNEISQRNNTADDAKTLEKILLNNTSTENVTSSSLDKLNNVKDAIDIQQKLGYSTTPAIPQDLDTLESIMINSTPEVKAELPSSNQDIEGKLYFLFGDKQIPARFIQRSDGQIKLGLDGVTLCDKLMEKGINASPLMAAMCKCSRSENCANNLNDLS